ncbi:MAG: ketosteroid isomerase [Subtercola sp.]|nr:ketosteroid isomerase [Subtercola sp.]
MPESTDTLQSLDPAIRVFFDATNGEDSAAFLAAFAPTAVLNDWGRVFRGLDKIAEWNAAENIGVHSRIAVLGTCPATDGRGGLEVKIKVSGEGYNGGGSFVFTTAGGLISSVLIQG